MTKLRTAVSVINLGDGLQRFSCACQSVSEKLNDSSLLCGNDELKTGKTWS